MQRSRARALGFALYEVLIGLTIFVVGIVVVGRSIENCMNASSLSAQEDRVRQILANRMAEVQATPGSPDTAREFRIESGYGLVRLIQKSAPADLKNEKNVEIGGVNRVTLIAQWSRSGTTQSKKIEFYVYRAG